VCSPSFTAEGSKEEEGGKSKVSRDKGNGRRDGE